MSEAVTVPSLMMMASIVSEQWTHTQTQTHTWTDFGLVYLKIKEKEFSRNILIAFCQAGRHLKGACLQRVPLQLTWQWQVHVPVFL